MSGHSKWSQIKHKKALTDAKKGVLFGKLARAISVAARGNPDPATNMRLKAEVDRARMVNMPNENIERAIRRVSDRGATELTEVQLELFGPGAAGIVVTAITDNSNRTLNELRQIAAQRGGSPAGSGAVSWMFSRTGIIKLTPNSGEEEQLAAIDAGATDVRDEDGILVVTVTPDLFERVRQRLGASVASATIEHIPSTTTPIPDAPTQRALESLLSALDDHDDVQDVITNAAY